LSEPEFTELDNSQNTQQNGGSIWEHVASPVVAKDFLPLHWR
jgi:hypothetical protein